MAQSKELKELAELAKKQLKLEKTIVSTEEKLKILQKELIVMREETFPAAMEKFELTDITIKGKKIELLNDFRCNFPSLGGIEKAKGKDRDRLIKRKKEAIKWLKENDHMGLLKTKVTFEFGMGEAKMLEKFRKRTEKSFPSLEHADQEAIHPASLKKFLKELGEEGIEYPKEHFGVSEYKRVEITEEDK